MASGCRGLTGRRSRSGIIIQNPSSVGVDTGEWLLVVLPGPGGPRRHRGPCTCTKRGAPVVASGESQLKVLDEETQARLRQYLEEHDRSVGRRANQPQFVTFPNGSTRSR